MWAILCPLSYSTLFLLVRIYRAALTDIADHIHSNNSELHQPASVSESDSMIDELVEIITHEGTTTRKRTTELLSPFNIDGRVLALLHSPVADEFAVFYFMKALIIQQL